jgi:hypothetical protein
MESAYLNVTFRGGKPLAAYYYLTDRRGQRSYRSRKAPPGLVVDYARNGEPLGIEIISPRTITMAAINRVLRELELPLVTRAELRPLRAAG